MCAAHVIAACMGCCTCQCPGTRRGGTQDERLIVDDLLSVKAIYFAAYRVCVETNHSKFPARWDAVVGAVAGHYMDLHFHPEYSLGQYILLLKNCIAVNNHCKSPVDVFDFLE
jgi:hypothetical protein